MRTWFVTGAARGLGYEIARYALDAGANVVVAARRLDQAGGLVGDLVHPQAGGRTTQERCGGLVFAGRHDCGWNAFSHLQRERRPR